MAEHEAAIAEHRSPSAVGGPSRGWGRLGLASLCVALLAGCPPADDGADEDSSGGEIMFEDEEAALQRSETHPATELVRRGESALSAGDADEARTLFEQAVAENDEDPRAHLDLGLVLELANDYEAAERHYQRALTLDPDFPEALNNLGLLLRDLERLEEAAAHLQHAVEVRPSLAEAHLNLAMTHEERGDAEAAVASYRDAIRTDSQSALPRANLGLLLLAMGEREQAAIELRRALPLARGDAAALGAIGNGLRRAGQADAAVRAMALAIEANGEPTAALLAELSLAQRANDDREAAEATLRRIIELDARYAVAHYLLAGMLAGRGEFDEAITHYQRYLALEPDGPQAARAREHLAAARARR